MLAKNVNDNGARRANAALSSFSRASSLLPDKQAKKSPVTEWTTGLKIGWMRPTKGALYFT
ncbi:hypothetical protein GCM10009091_04700 [Pseudomonas brenneri]|nr:hypothetical protein GCM10009091_04700 [Pseudomonas brenneri]